MRTAVVACLALLALAALSAHAANVKGVVSIDSATFDKVISGFKGKVLVKFDKQYPYGEKEDAFKAFATRVVSQGKKADGVLLASVGVGDYGEKENDDLRARFNMEASQFPQFRMFDRDSSKPTGSFDGAVTADALTAFLTRHSDLWIGLPGCLEKFDALAAKFVKAGASERAAVLAEAEKTDGGDEEGKESAQHYVSIMQKIVAGSVEYIDAETKRVEKVLKGKLADKPKKRLQNRLNILTSFSKHVAQPKAEL